MTLRFALFALSLLLIGAGPLTAAEDLGTQVTSKRALSPEETAQKQAREACKIEICDVLATREPHGPDIACDIGWTWHAEEILDAVSGRIDWPWGKAVCRSELRLERASLAKAMSAPSYELAANPQTVHCALHQKGGEPHMVTIDLAPRVTFKNGKATEAKVNWGDVSAPSAIYPLLYAATGLDNSTNALGSELVRQINKFTRKDCAEVKDQLPGRRVN
jgi:hypothetical protein